MLYYKYTYMVHSQMRSRTVLGRIRQYRYDNIVIILSRTSRSSDGVFVLPEDDATFSSYRTGQDETRVRNGRTVERLEGGDGRLRYDVATDGRFEPPGGRVGFPVVTTVVVVVLVLLLLLLQVLVLVQVVVVIGQPDGLFDGRQTGDGPTGGRPFVVIVVVIGQRRGRHVLFAAVVPGHTRDGCVPFGGRCCHGGRARARFGGVHFVTRPVTADG